MIYIYIYILFLKTSLSSIYSNVTDFTASPVVPPKPNSLPSSPQQQRGSNDVVTAQQGGLKLMSDVMDSSYRMFDGIGKLWQRDGSISSGGGKGGVLPPTSLSSSTSTSNGTVMDQMINRVRATSAAESELKDMPTNSNNGGSNIPKESVKDNNANKSRVKLYSD